MTEWESALHAEILLLRPDWTARQLRQAIGLPIVRERTAKNPELVRRAFLVAAADKAKPEAGYKGTWSPLRFKADGCPHWRTAAAQLEDEAKQSSPPVAPERTKAPTQRAPAPTSSAAPTADYMAAKAALSLRREAATAAS